jgi:hypothetical protein
VKNVAVKNEYSWWKDKGPEASTFCVEADSQPQDMCTTIDSQSGYRLVLPHVPGFSEFDTPLATAIIMGEPDPYKPRAETQKGNPYGPPVGFLERTDVDDHTFVEWQVSPDEGDDVDHSDDPHDIPQTDSADIAQHQSEDIAQPELKDVVQLEVPTLPWLKQNEVWTIGMFRRINI